MIGAFHQPSAVISDVATLDTLPERELRAGIAEVIKHGLALHAPFFDWLEANVDKLVRKDRNALMHAVRRSCELKPPSWPRTSASRARARSSTSAIPSATRSRRRRLRRLAARRGGSRRMVMACELSQLMGYLKKLMSSACARS